MALTIIIDFRVKLGLLRRTITEICALQLMKNLLASLSKNTSEKATCFGELEKERI